MKIDLRERRQRRCSRFSFEFAKGYAADGEARRGSLWTELGRKPGEG
jgi:hypothetical protein